MASRNTAPGTPPVRPAGRTQALQESYEMSGLARIVSARNHAASRRAKRRRGTVGCEREGTNASEASHSPKRPGGAP
jgi:hypothetical protein